MRDGSSAYLDVISIDAAPDATSMTSLPLIEEWSPSRNVRDAVTALMRGLRTTLDDGRYREIALVAYRLRPGRSPTVDLKVALRPSSVAMHTAKAGRPALSAADETAEWIPLRHADYQDVMDDPFGGNDVEAWYGDLPDTPTHEGPTGIGTTTGCHASWRGERIALRAGVGQTVMSVRIDVDGVLDAGDQDRTVGIALLRFLADLRDDARGTAGSDLTPLLAWIDGERTVNLRYAARGRCADPASSLHYAPKPSTPHVILPAESVPVRAARLEEWMGSIMAASTRTPPGAGLRRPGPLVTILGVASFILWTLLWWPLGIASAIVSIAMWLLTQPPSRSGRPMAQAAPAADLSFMRTCEEVRRLVLAHVPEERVAKLETALSSCRRLTALSSGSTDPALVEAATLVERHMPILLARFVETTRAANDVETSIHAGRLVDAVAQMGDHAEEARGAVVRSAGDALDTEIRYLRSRMGQTDPSLSTARLA